MPKEMETNISTTDLLPPPIWPKNILSLVSLERRFANLAATPDMNWDNLNDRQIVDTDRCRDYTPND